MTSAENHLLICVEALPCMAAIEDRRTRTAPDSRVIAQRYTLGHPLAHGGMASVWRGWDRRLFRPVAIKTLREEDMEDESAHARLRREAHVLAALSHPHIVDVHDMIEEDGRPYLIMELVEGEDLKRRIYRHGALEPLDALEIAQQICLALQATHDHNVIHRDVKPHNILLGPERQAKLVDFGLALSPLDSEPEESGVVFGTPEYMAPEQAMGQRITAATDLYGLGVTLYEALTGNAPFRSPSAEETMKRQISAPVTPLRSLRPDLGKGVEAVVMRALEKDADLRYSSARQMEAALGAAVYDARSSRSRFAVSLANLSARAPQTSDMAGPLSTYDVMGDDSLIEWETTTPEPLWIRLLWVMIAINIMLAITLLCVLALRVSM